MNEICIRISEKTIKLNVRAFFLSPYEFKYYKYGIDMTFLMVHQSRPELVLVHISRISIFNNFIKIFRLGIHTTNLYIRVYYY